MTVTSINRVLLQTLWPMGDPAPKVSSQCNGEEGVKTGPLGGRCANVLSACTPLSKKAHPFGAQSLRCEPPFSCRLVLTGRGTGLQLNFPSKYGRGQRRPFNAHKVNSRVYSPTMVGAVFEEGVDKRQWRDCTSIHIHNTPEGWGMFHFQFSHNLDKTHKYGDLGKLLLKKYFSTIPHPEGLEEANTIADVQYLHYCKSNEARWAECWEILPTDNQHLNNQACKTIH